MIQKQKDQYYETIAKTIIKNLEKRQMEGYYYPNRATAVEKALDLMPPGSIIGWGGSMTLFDMDLLNAISNNSYHLLDRDSAKNPQEQREIYSKIFDADFFLMSTNAITIAGELINIDHLGNRVSSLCFGPHNVLVFAGMNKLAPDLTSGVQRVRHIAAPLNSIRLDRKTPCTITGECTDCHSPESICDQIVITRRSSIPNRIKVFLIGEELGY